MANAFTNVVLSRHATLTAATVDSVTFASDHDQVEVVNRTGTAEIYFTTDSSTPTRGGSDTYCVPAALGAALRVSVTGATGPVVKLISTGTPDYSVTGL